MKASDLRRLVDRVKTTGIVSALVAGLLLAGCDLLREKEPELPDEEDIVRLFEMHRSFIGVVVRGNVVEARFRQSPDQIRRGGSLWAKVGPYVYLFAPPTRELFKTYPDVAALRVVMLLPNDVEVARAMLTRETFREAQWSQTHSMLGRALRDGTSKPSVLEDLVRWGERHTKYEYNPRFVRN